MFYHKKLKTWLNIDPYVFHDRNVQVVDDAENQTFAAARAENGSI
jgi:hypothetical protein